MSKKLFLLGALLSAVVASVPAETPTSGLELIRENDLRGKLTYLASDYFKGRGNGTEAIAMAAAYIARSFETEGAKPVGDRGSYFQHFDMYKLRLGQDNSIDVVEFDGSTWSLKLGTDFAPDRASANRKVSAPLMFAGFGIVAPHLKHNDFAGADLRGKIVVVLDRRPQAENPDSIFNEFSMIDFASTAAKARKVAELGGVGLIVVQNPLNKNPFIRVRSIAESFHPDMPTRRIPMGLVNTPDSPQIPIIVVSAEAGRQLVPGLRDIQRRIDQTLRSPLIDLKKRATLSVDFVREIFASKNVVGLIEGSDPVLKGEVVVIGAHYDHDGEANGEIWNGADDDGSGTTALLELAEAFGNGGPRPARSILLCAWSGEEKGLLGSRYYISDPIMPLEKTVAMLQMDMIGRNEDHPENKMMRVPAEQASDNTNSVNVLWSVFSAALKDTIVRMNAETGLEVKFRYDYSRENLIKRSDNWPFLEKGVPAAFFFTGLHPDYHTPRDTADKINYSKLEKIVRLVYRTAMDVANGKSRPDFTKPAPAPSNN